MESSIPIYFQFVEKKSALQAFDTLRELDYNIEWLEHDHLEHLPTLLLILNQSDLTSALEIAQSHGGRLVEGKQSAAEIDILTAAYDLEYIPIPAHTVNDEELLDPSEEPYDHFPAGIRL
jgi:hypothetical protein